MSMSEPSEMNAGYWMPHEQFTNFHRVVLFVIVCYEIVSKSIYKYKNTQIYFSLFNV